MRYVFVVFFLLFSFGFAGCSKEKAAEMYNTAQFEELQNNQEHALKLYQEIIEKYPGSEYAKKAGERISQLKQKSSGPPQGTGHPKRAGKIIYRG
ncbi:MAG: hypothetical protein OEW04_03900 [Nitrospirota bacterium]|nr:hypothetical protein [Nitrospirota bacterium]